MDVGFRQDEDELTFIESQLATPPCINIIDKETFNNRIHDVFDILYEALAKSFGPGGAGTFISIYPKYFNTKDGFTIMKNIAFDKKLDQVICDMVMDICSRLNFTVGDGTTTAVIATGSIYNKYALCENDFAKMNILPRDIINRLNRIKDDILASIDKEAIHIRTDDPDELESSIRKVVWISSNGNQQITDMISTLYHELMYPAISCTLAKDGIMKYKIVTGYNIDVSLMDKIYINNDDNTMVLNGANVIIFDHKVTKDTYQKILVPLNLQSRGRGKHLVCIAPYYDEVALGGVIRSDLLAEYKKSQDVNLVLTACTKTRGSDKVKLDDLAMLLNTTMITSQMEMDLIAATEAGKDFAEIYNLDSRDIEGLSVAYNVDNEHLRLAPYTKDSAPTPYGYEYRQSALRVGYCDDLTIGLKDSTFSGFYYDENEYRKYMNIAKAELAEVQRRVETVGTYSFELIQKQERVHALSLKTGIIEVGATSEISQNYLKDMVDDAVKAAESAYNNGVVLGCNVTLSKVTLAHASDFDKYDDLDRKLLNIIADGFVNVYQTVINNVAPDVAIIPDPDVYDETHSEWTEDEVKELVDRIHQLTPFKNLEFTADELNACHSLHKINRICNLYDFIIRYSIFNNKVIDLGDGGRFTSDIINSAETDKEILKATIDLLSLLITGNQMVMR